MGFDEEIGRDKGDAHRFGSGVVESRFLKKDELGVLDMDISWDIGERSMDTVSATSGYTDWPTTAQADIIN